jgi:hypothetical protein
MACFNAKWPFILVFSVVSFPQLSGPLLKLPHFLVYYKSYPPFFGQLQKPSTHFPVNSKSLSPTFRSTQKACPLLSGPLQLFLNFCKWATRMWPVMGLPQISHSVTSINKRRGYLSGPGQIACGLFVWIRTNSLHAIRPDPEK